MSDLQAWYRYVLQQLVAESYLEGITDYHDPLVRARLLNGNNRIGYPDVGLSRLTPQQADEFLANYTIKHQLSDNATAPRTEPVYLPNTTILANTGLSATLIQSKSDPSQYTLAIRSTEFQNWDQGGDYERDGRGADLSIFLKGFAFAQLDALDRYFAWLKSSASGNLLPAGSTLTVTGYSLGGGLAAAFTLLHDNEIAKTYTFNGAGVGRWDAAQGTLRDVLGFYRAVLANPDAAGWVPDSGDLRLIAYGRAKASSGLSARSIYDDARYQWAIEAVQHRFATTYDFTSDPSRTLSGSLESKITQLFGRATHNDSEWVSNSGLHGRSIPIFIEGQPGVEVLSGVGVLPGDFGNTHSIVLLADSLALMRAFQAADSDLTQAQIEAIFAASSNQRSSFHTFTKVEADSLERALDALRKVVGVPSYATNPVTPPEPGLRGFGDADARERFYARLDELTRALNGITYDIRPLVDAAYRYGASGRMTGVEPRMAVDLQRAASQPGDDGRAYRYALRELNPFVVFGADYTPGTRLNSSGDLELFDADAANNGMTPSYLADRAELMRRYLAVNVENDQANGVNYGSGGLDSDGAPLNWRLDSLYFEDRANDFRLGQGGQLTTRTRVVFGGDGPDQIEGGSLADRLYGSSGADVLRGADGDDYIEGGDGADELIGAAGSDRLFGGAGADTYIWNSGDGLDVISDSDGLGRIVYDGRPLAGGEEKSDGVFVDSAGLRYVLVPLGAAQRLLVEGTVTIENFHNGDLGIQLGDGDGRPDQPPIVAVQSYVDDVIPLGLAPSDALGHALNFAGSGANDSVVDGVGLSFATREGDDSVVLLFAAADASKAYDLGAGNDLIDASLVGPGTGEALSIIGGGGADYIIGSRGADAVWGDNRDVSSLAAAPYPSVRLDSLIYYFLGDPHGIAEPHVLNQWNVDVARALDVRVSDLVETAGWFMPGGLVAAAQYAVGGPGTGFDDYVDAGDGDDVVFGGSGDDLLYGETGSDILIGDFGGFDGLGVALPHGGFVPAELAEALGADFAAVFGQPGDDVLDGDAGNDVLIDADLGNDIFLGGEGDDRIVSIEARYGETQPMFNHIEAGGGNDTITATNLTGGGSDYIDAGEGNDVLLVSASDAYVNGGLGDDSYTIPFVTVLSPDGQSVSVRQTFMLHDDGGADRLSGLIVPQALDPSIFLLVSSVEPTSLIPSGFLNVDRVERHGSDLLKTGFSSTGGANVQYEQRVVFERWFDGDQFRIENILTDGGMPITADQLEARGLIHIGGEGHQWIWGTDRSDQVLAGAGNDVVTTFGGDDLLAGLGGDDLLDGGDGNDIYFWGGGHGSDQIVDASGIDELWFSAAVNASDITVSQTRTSILLAIGSEALELHVDIGSAQGDLPIDLLVFADGSSVTLADIVDLEAFASSVTPFASAVVGNEDPMFEFDVLAPHGEDDAGVIPSTVLPPGKAEPTAPVSSPSSGDEAGGDTGKSMLRVQEGAEPQELRVAPELQLGHDFLIGDDSASATSVAVRSLADSAAFSTNLGAESPRQPEYRADVPLISLKDLARAIQGFESSGIELSSFTSPSRVEGNSTVETISSRKESPGVSSWAMTNALLEWHLAHMEADALGSSLEHPLRIRRLLPTIAEALDGASGSSTSVESTALQPLSGLREGFSSLA